MLNKQNKIIIIIISLILVLTVGYALFSETLNINGTAKASGNFNLIFSEVLRNNVKKEGATIDVDNIIIKDESKTLSIGDVTLNYPSAYVSVPAMIRNEGSIDAVLKGIRVENPSAEDIEVSYSGVAKDELFKSGEEKEITIMIRWKKESITAVEKQDFNIYLDYEQAPDGYVPPASEEMTRDMFIWDSETVVAGLSDKGIEHLRNNGGKLVIPEGTTEIASPSFNPETGEGAFDKGFSPFSIGKFASWDSDASEKVNEYSIIRNVHFPSSLKKIGNFAFSYNVNMISTLNLPENIEEIGEWAFSGSQITGKLVIPNKVRMIGKGSFIETQITSIYLGNSLETIGESAFEDCENLSGELYIPDSVRNIGYHTFAMRRSQYNKITSISVSKNANYHIDAFQGRITPTIRD